MIFPVRMVTIDSCTTFEEANHMRKLAFVAVIWLVPFLPCAAQDHRDLDRKDGFTQGFPQFLAFRGEIIRSSHRDYAAWCESVPGHPV